MKRFLGLLICAIVFNSCDDGDVIVENINFEDVNTQSCATNNLIYKIKDKESLILDIPASSFVNNPTEEGKPTLIPITNDNRVVYRFYNGPVTADNICETIPPATPNVIDQWTGTEGKIQITTTAVKTSNTTPGSTKITGYNHAIVFKDITFVKSKGTQVYETFTFGNYVTPATTLPFLFDESLEMCNTANIYNYNSSESFTLLNIDPALLSTTVLNTPKTGLISTTTNKLVYRLFTNGVLTQSYFCNATTPVLPSVSEEWIAVTGETNIGGIIEVTTTTFGTGFKHTIVFKKVTMKKGNSDFKLGDSILFGEFLTTN